jgi:hypothetical protein
MNTTERQKPMFKKKPTIDWEATARGLARSIGAERLRQSLDGGYVTAQAFAELENEIPWRAPDWSYATATNANIRHEPPSMLRLWQAIRTNRATTEIAPTHDGGGWFSANRD